MSEELRFLLNHTLFSTIQKIDDFCSNFNASEMASIRHEVASEALPANLDTDRKRVQDYVIDH